MEAQQSLFRKEAISNRSERLAGAVNLALPVSWQLIGWLLLTALVAAAAFAFSTTYSRVERVDGAIVLDRGVATVAPSRLGVIETVRVREGEHVRLGDPLFRVTSEEGLRSGGTLTDRIGRALEQQDARFSAQTKLLHRGAKADRMRLLGQVAGGRLEAAEMRSQIQDQQRLVDTARSDYDNASEIAARGFVSRRDMNDRLATLISRRQQLAQLRQSLTAKETEVDGAGRGIVQSAASADAQVAAAESSRASLRQQMAQNEQARGFILVAPVSGTVTALSARVGQLARLDQVLALVVPDHAAVRAELYVPTAAAGFLARGQEVRLAVDAFPFERFGTVGAHIDTISTAAVPRLLGQTTTPVYLVTAVVDPGERERLGRTRSLLPGMTLAARIVTEQRSLIQWLFEPLFAARGR